MNKKTSKTHTQPPINSVKKELRLNGRVYCKTSYANDKKHGIGIYYRNNDTKVKEKMWRHDKQHGLEREWYKSGMKMWEEIWNEEKQHGVDSWWWESGGKKQEIYYFCGEGYASIKWNEKGRVSSVKFPPRSQPTKSKTNPSITSTVKSRKII